MHTGKWGVADGPVYERILKDMIASDKKEKHLRVVMSESSHEPFDVPFKSHIKEPELNAFYYADKCLGEFVEAMKKKTDWDNTLVLIVPDHLGAYCLCSCYGMGDRCCGQETEIEVDCCSGSMERYYESGGRDFRRFENHKGILCRGEDE